MNKKGKIINMYHRESEYDNFYEALYEDEDLTDVFDIISSDDSISYYWVREE